MISFQSAYQKFQALSGSTNATDLVQGKQDVNIGYQRFNAAIARYFTRKQLFTDLVANQQYYQIPVDSLRVSTVTVKLSATYQIPLVQVRDETDWRNMNAFSYSSNYITSYFVLGSDQIGLYPTPSATVSNGLRFVYQPQDVELTKDDYSTGTVSVTTGGVAVTGVGTTWTSNHVGMMFKVTDGTDGNWYEITAVSSTTTLTLKTPYAGIQSASGAAYIIGQVFIFPGEYDDVPVDYALARYFEAQGEMNRANYHTNRYNMAVKQAVEAYASSSISNVITGPDDYLNPWFAPPTAG